MPEQNQQKKQLKSATNIISKNDVMAELQERIKRHTLTDEEKQKIRDEIEKEDAELAKRALNADRNHQLNKIFSNSMINKKLENASFENYHADNEDNTRALAICKRYAETFSLKQPRSLLLTGSYGVGKSHLAASIMRAISKIDIVLKKDDDRDVILKSRKPTMIFINTPKLLTKIRSSFSKTSDFTEADLLNEIESVDLLVLDDFGSEIKEANNDFAVQKIFEIVEGRVGKHTIYTTNFNVDELFNFYGERNFSRIMEDANLIQMTGENYRLRGFKK
ncbi:ATP-binding protein [Listeria monocytogenes]|nr:MULTISPECIES: DnaC [Listeria]EAD8780236.1 ATP-binding protein [Listeria monocytogenes]EAE1846076.1 ATP-binding protein [Listeria monocytogenes]EAF2835964.1 ATP-binding protein [Listeria monocytogenes]EAF8400864.1 ATP-binding protein [Listeria monocytogenes]EAG1414828.1 ATP-binding protein [Listeria monocytogenes]